MSEAVPSIAIAKMSNSLLPLVSSRLPCYGNNEDQLENLKACMQMDDLIGHFHGNAFYMESIIFNNGSQLEKVGYTMPSQTQSIIQGYNHQPGNLYGISSREDISQQSSLTRKRPSDSQYEGVRGKARKRPSEVIDNMALFKKMGKNTMLEPKWHQGKEILEKIPGNKLHVPVRRNQKLSDKITTLQKLVSPFGKTDTASVLHEASLYIKLLQEQIQMLSFSYNNTVQVPHKQKECGGKLVDLRSRGLCLVPISITPKVTIGRAD